MTQLKFNSLKPDSLKCGDKTLDLSRPAVMGILNITPDSFSDGGQLYSDGQLDQSKTLRAAEAMLSDGADIIDIGGESTRPGAAPVSVAQELDRVMPILNAVQQRFDCLVSVDTSTAQVITQAAVAGANIINDVRALQREGALPAALQIPSPMAASYTVTASSIRAKPFVPQRLCSVMVQTSLI